MFYDLVGEAAFLFLRHLSVDAGENLGFRHFGVALLDAPDTNRQRGVDNDDLNNFVYATDLFADVRKYRLEHGYSKTRGR